MMTTQDDTRTGPGTGAALLAFAAFMAFSGIMVFQNQRAGGASGGQAGTETMETDDTSHIEVGAVLGNSTIRSRVHAFHDADVAAVFGHSEIDLTAAQLAAGRGTIDVFVMFGQADVRVPSDWTVVTKNLVTLGSVENHARGSGTDPNKSLRVEGVVLFGELRILRGR
jgi:predicted membrane protein